MSVIAAIPYYRCAKYICRAVESLLAQTHKDLTIVVLNDADTKTPPWPQLAHIHDPRLVRIDLARNRGPYFALQVAVAATPASYLLIQDADDWSHPERVARLLKAIETDKADVAISGHLQFREAPGGKSERLKTYLPNEKELAPGAGLKMRLRHHGLFSVRALRNVGGYYGGFRMSYDMFLTNLLLLTCRVAVVNEPLYNYYLRPDSLTTSAATGLRSETRRKVEIELRRLYGKAYSGYMKFIGGQMAGADLFKMIRDISQASISAGDQEELQREAGRLKAMLETQNWRG
jgi:glycosyltransferase involved in cell wall biosynthesis